MSLHLFDDATHNETVLLDSFWSQGLVQQVAQLGVVGRIAEHHPPGENAKEGVKVRSFIVGQLPGEKRHPIGGEPLGVPQHRHHVRIAGEHPTSPVLVPVDRIRVPQSAVVRVGIANHLRSHQIIAQSSFHIRPPSRLVALSRDVHERSPW